MYVYRVIVFIQEDRVERERELRIEEGCLFFEEGQLIKEIAGWFEGKEGFIEVKSFQKIRRTKNGNRL